MSVANNVGLLCVAAVLAGCSGARISLDHFGEAYGQAPPIPEAGGSGPQLFKPAIDVPDGGLTIPTRLPDLLAAHREQLRERVHLLPTNLAEQYADVEIASLRKRYAGRDDALRAELTRRLRPVIASPGPLDAVNQLGPLYPTDEAPRLVPPRKPL